MDRDGEMGAHLDGSTGGGVCRLEVIEGSSGRRRRTKAEGADRGGEPDARAKVTDVARRHVGTAVQNWATVAAG